MILENIEKVNKLQRLSYRIYLNTIQEIKAGMNEVDIATVISKQFKERGIDKFWYDVPIMILIGEERFLDMTRDYEVKNPSVNHQLKIGDTINVDVTPMDEKGYWGDFSATCVFQPTTDYDFEKVGFLKLMRKIQRDGIMKIKSVDTGRDIANWYLGKFEENNITLIDVRETFGHSMHHGSKKYSNGHEKRIFIDVDNTNPIGEDILAIEPGGYMKSTLDKNKILVGRFEDCVYIPPSGNPILLAPKEEIPFFN